MTCTTGPERLPGPAPWRLALFDLDHTLIPFDSGMAWTAYLVQQGVLPPRADAEYLAWCRQAVAGTLDIHAMHRATVAPLTRHGRAQLALWVAGFQAHVAPRLPAQRRALVQAHRARGDLCVLVTATTRFIAEPLARLFDIPHLVATEPATVGGDPAAPLTGEIHGLPCWRGHKPVRLAAWLAEAAPPGVPRSLAGFERSWFYSDAAGDLPLLQAVTDPVAVAPDAALRQAAQAAGWPVIEAVA